MMILWIKALHVIAMVCWFAGLFYLPRLFVYHAQTVDTISLERFKVMERRLYYGIMTPAAIITILSGLWLLSANFTYYLSSLWMPLKLVLVSTLIIYHFYSGKLMQAFQHNKNRYSHRYYRWFNELPTLILITVVILVIVRP